MGPPPGSPPSSKILLHIYIYIFIYIILPNHVSSLIRFYQNQNLERQFIGMLVLDEQRAFDSVKHNILFNKLNTIGNIFAVYPKEVC